MTDTSSPIRRATPFTGLAVALSAFLFYWLTNRALDSLARTQAVPRMTPRP